MATHVILERADVIANALKDNIPTKLSQLANDVGYVAKNELTKESVGLENVDNTADANKKVAEAIKANSAESATSADSAKLSEQATSDKLGQELSSTYIKEIAYDSNTLTVIKGDNSALDLNLGGEITATQEEFLALQDYATLLTDMILRNDYRAVILADDTSYLMDDDETAILADWQYITT